jgi:hypothetical protein
MARLILNVLGHSLRTLFLAIACLPAFGAEDVLPAKRDLSDGSTLQVVELCVDVGATSGPLPARTSVNFVTIRARICNTSDKDVHLSRFLLDSAFGLYGRFEDTNSLQWEVPIPPSGAHVTHRADYIKEVMAIPTQESKWITVSLLVGDVGFAPINRHAMKNKYSAWKPTELRFYIFAPVYLVNPESPDTLSAAAISGSCTAVVNWRTGAAAGSEHPKARAAR